VQQIAAGTQKPTGISVPKRFLGIPVLSHTAINARAINNGTGILTWPVGAISARSQQPRSAVL
jgi:hypothetical protein